MQLQGDFSQRLFWKSKSMPGLSSWISLPENRAAALAVERVTEAICAGQVQGAFNPLFLAGPSGTGKSRLAALLVEQVTQRVPATLVRLLNAADVAALHGEGEAQELADARRADLLIVEDLQHLPERAVEAFVSLVD